MSLNRRQFLTQGTALALGSVLGSVPSVSSSADNIPITRIEEDWEIKVANPNPDFNTPEIITSLGPLPDDLEPVGYLLINHETQPAYTAGGIQLQVWQNRSLVGYANHGDFRRLATLNETIQFTLVMLIENGNIKYQITNGSSKTFGSFEGLSISARTQVRSLSTYDPLDSIRRSEVTVGGNRLSKYQLNEVRYSDGTPDGVTVDTTVRSIL